MSNYVMRHDVPVMESTKIDFWAVIDKITEDLPYSTSDDKPCETADVIRWVEQIARKIGFASIEHFPFAWDGEGCHVLSRYEKPEKCAEGFRDFEYIAFLSMHYEYTVAIGIPNDMALIQFYTLVRPMLMLQSEPRFKDAADSEGDWKQGKSQKDLYRNLLEQWNIRQAKAKKDAKNS